MGEDRRSDWRSSARRATLPQRIGAVEAGVAGQGQHFVRGVEADERRSGCSGAVLGHLKSGAIGVIDKLGRQQERRGAGKNRVTSRHFAGGLAERLLTGRFRRPRSRSRAGQAWR
jgi:hypothetical protein